MYVTIILLINDIRVNLNLNTFLNTFLNDFRQANQNKRTGRMAKKGGQVVLQEEINTNDDWKKMKEKSGMYGKQTHDHNNNN